MGPGLRGGEERRGSGLWATLFPLRTEHQVTTGKSCPYLESRAQRQDHPLRISGFGAGEGVGLEAEEVGSWESEGQGKVIGGDRVESRF